MDVVSELMLNLPQLTGYRLFIGELWKGKVVSVQISSLKKKIWTWRRMDSVLRQFLPHGLSSTAAVPPQPVNLTAHVLETMAA